MSTFQQYNIDDALTSCRLCSLGNIVGTYSNGPNNNGVGATFTVAASSLTIDSVIVNVGDRILLGAQSSSFQNGIYVVNSIGSTVVLQRAADFQSIEQMRTGQYVAISAGTALNGLLFVLVEPKPSAIGSSSIMFNSSPSTASLGTAAFKTASDNTQSNVASVKGTPSTPVAGAVPTFADTSGTIFYNATNLTVKKFSNAGGSATLTITDANIAAGQAVFAAIQNSANAVSIQKVTPASGSVTILFSGDPGASGINYMAINVQ